MDCIFESCWTFPSKCFFPLDFSIFLWQKIIEDKKGEFLLQNEETSAKYCQAQLKQLSETLMESISRGTFSVPGGHNLYLEARKTVEQSYQLVPSKGVKVRNKQRGKEQQIGIRGFF